MGAWVAAVDGGGTKTAAALASERGGVLRLTDGAGSNPQDGGDWEGTLRQVLGRVLEEPGGVAAVVLGIGGYGEVPEADAAVTALLRDLLPTPWEAMNDVALARLAAFGGGDGVLVLAGTGSMAWAKGPRGEARVGGWGDVIGDEGSAGWIGRAALALAARAMDGRAPEAVGFARSLCGRLGARGDFAPLAWLMAQPGTPRAAVASVARHVDALAQEGDGEALRLIRAAAAELALAARIAAGRVGMTEGFGWAPAGSAFRSEALGRTLAEMLGREADAPRLTALGGGLLRAVELAGWEAGEGWAATVDARLRALASGKSPVAG